jgi:2-hydroxychromene-2-carboxylate isomerase
MNLVVFADFNCPYSWLASARADVLLELRSTDVEWRAVEHDPTISEPSDPVDGERQAPLDRELEEVRGLLQPDEVFPLRRPPVLPNTARAVAAFATAPPQERPALRRRLFTALWIDGRDIGDDRVLRDLGASPSDRGTALASGWRAAWLGTGGPVVPTLVQPDGDVARGVEALTCLAEMNAPTAAPPQWPPTDIG